MLQIVHANRMPTYSKTKHKTHLKRGTSRIHDIKIKFIAIKTELRFYATGFKKKGFTHLKIMGHRYHLIEIIIYSGTECPKGGILSQ